jgi:hypothetical protein
VGSAAPLCRTEQIEILAPVGNRSVAQSLFRLDVTPLPEASISERVSSRRAAPRPPASDKRGLWRALGPGLLTGASDDDPSGIATYSQAGAQFGGRGDCDDRVVGRVRVR